MIVDFSKFSSIKIGAKLEVKEIDEESYEDGFVVGGATNSLICSDSEKILILSDKYRYIKIEDGYLKVGAKTRNRELFNFCKLNDIGGFEFLSHLPGTIGGTIKMNAGMKQYEISDGFVALKSLSGYRENVKFGYRYSDIDYPVFEVVFRIDKKFNTEIADITSKMRLNQPKEPSLGSVFKNPEGDYAGRLIEEVGLKGYQMGGVMFSNKHANFLVNIGNGSCKAVLFLIEEAEKRIYEKFGIKLEREIIIKGDK